MAIATGVLIVLLVAATAGRAEAAHGAAPGMVPAVPVDYAAQLVRLGESIVFVDLRPRADFDAGHIPGAVSVPMAELARRVAEVPRSGRVILYCQCSTTELSAAHRVLSAAGYHNHTILADGYPAWVARGLPIAR
jgi:ArsR family transcriptional regulator